VTNIVTIGAMYRVEEDKCGEIEAKANDKLRSRSLHISFHYKKLSLVNIIFSLPRKKFSSWLGIRLIFPVN
jgi:hypothetical protein